MAWFCATGPVLVGIGAGIMTWTGFIIVADELLYASQLPDLETLALAGGGALAIVLFHRSQLAGVQNHAKKQDLDGALASP